MRVVAVVQARYSSRRLPGKILRELCGRPALDYLLDALRHCSALEGVVLATSTDPTDDATADFAARRSVPCYRGSLEDVARRILEAAEAHRAEAVARVNGDSPLLDPALIEQGVELFLSQRPDIATNVHPRTFPKGQSVEVISVTALRRATLAMKEPDEREHVTLHFYKHADEYAIHSFTTEPPRPEVQLSIDDADDFARCAALIPLLSGPPWRAGWRACVAAYDALLGTTGGRQ